MTRRAASARIRTIMGVLAPKPGLITQPDDKRNDEHRYGNGPPNRQLFDRHSETLLVPCA
jgi:hypothetical protein